MVLSTNKESKKPIITELSINEITISGFIVSTIDDINALLLNPNWKILFNKNKKNINLEK